jgi:hypothetical protein
MSTGTGRAGGACVSRVSAQGLVTMFGNEVPAGIRKISLDLFSGSTIQAEQAGQCSLTDCHPEACLLALSLLVGF